MRVERQLIIFFLLLGFNLFGQKNGIFKKYSDFLEPDSLGQNHIVTFGYQYLYTPNYKAFRTGGFHLSFGLNLARLLTKKIVLGPYIEIKGVKGFTGQKFSSEFISDFNANFNTTYSNQRDSVCARIVHDAVNRNGVNFGGNYSGSYGLIFSPFPNRFGGICFIVKKGYRNYPTHGANDYKDWETDDHPGLYLTDNISYEVSLKPYALFKKSYIYFKKLRATDPFKLLTITFYYEKLNLKNAEFKDLPLRQMVSQSFMDKYGVTENFGFKIGLTFY